MKLGTFFDHNETLDREFKEFCLKTEIKKIFSKCEIYQIIKNGVLPGKYNKIVLNNIKLYIQSYFPKYICSFHNNKDAVFHRMNIYIGIDDHSEITGILKLISSKFILPAIKLNTGKSYDFSP